jgi:hypothetical protein
MAKRGTWKSGICAASGIAVLAAARVALDLGVLHFAIGIPLMGMGMALALGGFIYFRRQSQVDSVGL